MAACVKCLLLFSSAFGVLALADNRVQFNEEHEKRWNTPPELTPEQVTGKKSAAINGRPEARFLPFSASFTLNAGHDNGDALQLGSGLGGISVSQSSSYAQAGANSFGNSGSLAASQSTSFAAGLTGIAASDANSFSVNHPVFGGQSNANSNSFGIGQAGSSSQANAQNGQASSGSQAFVGTVHSSSASGGNVQVLSDGLTIGQQHGSGRPTWTNIGPNHDFPGHPISNRPTLTIQEAPVVNNQKRPTTIQLGGYDSRWHQSRPQLHVGEWHQKHQVGFQGHQWRPYSPHEYAQGQPSIPNAWLQGQGQGQGQGQDQGQGYPNGGDGLHVGVASASSSASTNVQGHAQAQAQGTAISFHRNRDGRTRDGDFVKFPGQSNVQSIPKEFVRSKESNARGGKDFIDAVVSEITDTVSDLLDIS